MKTIYLTERDIHRMIKESVQTLLLEALTPDEIYNKYYSTIDKNIFDVAIAADPTSYNQQGEIVKVGKYVKWILDLAKQEKWKPGDSVETKDLLGKFNKHKSKLPAEQRDINRYSSVRQLYDILQPYLDIKSRREIKQGAEKVYEDNEWLIIIPHTEEAACYYGANTKWCTAAEEDNMFNYYNNYNDDGDSPLYINIHKPTNSKYQFHFETDSFMDEEDEEIQPNDLPWTKGALNYYKSINKEIYFKYDSVKVFDNGIAIVELNDKYNWFSLEKQELLFPNQWFDEVYNFDSKGIAKVELNGKQTWFSLGKQDYLFPNKWFDWVDKFYDGIALVKLNGKYTWFSLEKQELLSPKLWFDWIDKFDSNGIAPVKLNGKYTWFSLEKQDYLFPNKWFDWIDDFDGNGIALVKLNDEYYDFNLDGQLLDINTRQPLPQEQVQKLFQQQQQIDEMVNRLVRNYLR